MNEEIRKKATIPQRIKIYELATNDEEARQKLQTLMQGLGMRNEDIELLTGEQK